MAGERPKSNPRRDVIIAVALVGLVALFIAAANYLLPTKSSAVLNGSPLLRIVPESMNCKSDALCQITVQNTGAAIGWISGAGPSLGSVTFWTSPASVPAPGQTIFNITITGGSPREVVEGYLMQEGGGNLEFNSTLP